MKLLTDTKHSPSKTGALVLAITFLLSAACATNNVKTLRIDTRHIEAIGYMPVEITNMMYDLGYDLLPDPNPARAVEKYEQYRMHFRARDSSDIRIDVHIRMTDNVTGIHFYEKGKQQLGETARQRYGALKRRVDIQFGRDHIVEGRSLRTP